ncbi:hypothetical protein F2Q68_00026372 [Brassica cretica]|uniref:Uncharacterized protein n=1 Tax=Brassica cretica TaxID=69181 RepID=A0A8S9IGP1_BRACR|nr:hypothetical protein F2Q68_00026372 [Brassica cretica]
MPEIFRGCEPRNVDKRISLDEVSIVSKDRPPRPRARTVSTRVTLPMDEDDPHRGHLAHRRGRPAPRSPRPWARTTRTEVTSPMGEVDPRRGRSEGSLQDARLWCLRTRGRERPWCVAPTSRSGLRERPQWVALRGRSGLRFVSSRHGNASDLGASLWQVALRGRLHGVAPVRSLWCAARPLIALNTSFELQMHPNASKNSMWYSNT